MQRVLAGQDLLYIQKTKRFEEYLGTKWVRPDLAPFSRTKNSHPYSCSRWGDCFSNRGEEAEREAVFENTRSRATASRPIIGGHVLF